MTSANMAIMAGRKPPNSRRMLPRSQRRRSSTFVAVRRAGRRWFSARRRIRSGCASALPTTLSAVGRRHMRDPRPNPVHRQWAEWPYLVQALNGAFVRDFSTVPRGVVSWRVLGTNAEQLHRALIKTCVIEGSAMLAAGVEGQIVRSYEPKQLGGIPGMQGAGEPAIAARTATWRGPRRGAVRGQAADGTGEIGHDLPYPRSPLIAREAKRSPSLASGVGTTGSGVPSTPSHLRS